MGFPTRSLSTLVKHGHSDKLIYHQNWARGEDVLSPFFLRLPGIEGYQSIIGYSERVRETYPVQCR